MNSPTCPTCGSRIVMQVMIGGEVERFCLAASHPVFTDAEIRERDAFLVRRGEVARVRSPMVQGVRL